MSRSTSPLEPLREALEAVRYSLTSGQHSQILAAIEEVEARGNYLLTVTQLEAQRRELKAQERLHDVHLPETWKGAGEYKAADSRMMIRQQAERLLEEERQGKAGELN